MAKNPNPLSPLRTLFRKQARLARDLDTYVLDNPRPVLAQRRRAELQDVERGIEVLLPQQHGPAEVHYRWAWKNVHGRDGEYDYDELIRLEREREAAKAIGF